MAGPSVRVPIVAAFLPVAGDVRFRGAGADGRRIRFPQTGRRAGRGGSWRCCSGLAARRETKVVAVVVLRVRAGLVAAAVDVAVEVPRVAVVDGPRPAQELGATQFRTLRPVLDRRAVATLLQSLLLQATRDASDVQLE